MAFYISARHTKTACVVTILSPSNSLPLFFAIFRRRPGQMMPEHKMQLLALHGKGTSARIMKAQIKPLVDLLDNVLDVHYMDGGETSAPYQGRSAPLCCPVETFIPAVS